MTTRVLPSPDIFASCPLDGKILDYYEGTFEAVLISLISLNPFIEPVSIDKAEFLTGSWPSHSSIVTHGKPVSCLKFASQASVSCSR